MRRQPINVMPAMRDWYERNVVPPPAAVPASKRRSAEPKVRTPVTDLEARAIAELQSVTFPVGVGAKGFARQVHGATELTEGQRTFLWSIVWRYRRQVQDQALVAIAKEKGGH